MRVSSLSTKLLLLFLFYPYSLFGQIYADTTINNGLKLWVYEDWKDLEINSVDGTTELENYKNTRLSANSVDETTELNTAQSDSE